LHRLREEIEDFHSFAKERLSEGAIVSLDELYERWRECNPVAQDAIAIQASLRDMENGETGRTFKEFAADFANHNRIADCPWVWVFEYLLSMRKDELRFD
jgi:hypothetical protein